MQTNSDNAENNKNFFRSLQNNMMLKRKLSLLNEQISVLEYLVPKLRRENRRRILFLFSDALSMDDPGSAGRRLCQNNIIPVVIGIGQVSLREVERIKSYCGVYYGIDTPVENVIENLKVTSQNCN